MKLAEFLSRNRISQEVWEKSNSDWKVLSAIADDYNNQYERLRDAADIFSRTLQRFPGVHSVRWRIKNAEHLIEKIIRKRADKREKYLDISEKNYAEIVADLVGVRALHLFKEECFSIDSDLRSTWQPIEKPIAYVRKGDPNELTEKFIQCGFEIEEHPAGYRSIHYVCATQPTQRKVLAEIQVRTIFEEGWSEIDHRIRYPNFSDDKLVAYFLTILNRFAGSADEMGSFVQGLTGAVQGYKNELAEAYKQKEKAVTLMNKMVDDLEALKKQDASANKKLSALQQEIERLQKMVPFGARTNTAASINFHATPKMSDLAAGGIVVHNVVSDVNLTPADLHRLGVLDDLRRRHFGAFPQTPVELNEIILPEEKKD